VSSPGKRRTAREMAVQMLYQQDVGGTDLPQVFLAFDLAPYLEPSGGAGKEAHDPQAAREKFARRRKKVDTAFTHARRLVEGTVENRDRIDALIRQQADNWRLERMPVVDRNILRLAVYEMTYEGEIPKLVVVDEAIELAKRFGSENSGRFINGLLDGLLKRDGEAEASASVGEPA
jgi:transcription antitermination protein NusB